MITHSVTDLLNIFNTRVLLEVVHANNIYNNTFELLYVSVCIKQRLFEIKIFYVFMIGPDDLRSCF